MDHDSRLARLEAVANYDAESVKDILESQKHRLDALESALGEKVDQAEMAVHKSDVETQLKGLKQFLVHKDDNPCLPDGR